MRCLLLSNRQGRFPQRCVCVFTLILIPRFGWSYDAARWRRCARRGCGAGGTVPIRSVHLVTPTSVVLDKRSRFWGLSPYPRDQRVKRACSRSEFLFAKTSARTIFDSPTAPPSICAQQHFQSQLASCPSPRSSTSDGANHNRQPRDEETLPAKV